MKVEIEKKDQVFRFDVAEGENVLYAGLRAGVPLPYECATGTCGTCKARLKEGALDFGWADAPGKKNLKPERKEFLMCQAHGVTDCSIGVPAAIKPFRNDDISPRDHQGVASNWQRLTHDVMQFDVTLSSPVQFHAGQFFVVTVPGLEGPRAYSMVNYSPQTERLEFIIKSKPDGGFSDWAFDDRRNLDAVRIFGPLGRASFHPDEGHDLLMIGGGSGIAGLMSILEHGSAVNYFDQHKADVYFGVRTDQDAFFIDRLSAVKNSMPDNVNINIVFSDQKELDTSGKNLGSLTPAIGMVHEVALAATPPAAPNLMAYLAGPPPMVDALIRPLLLELKMPVNMIRYDKFG